MAPLAPPSYAYEWTGLNLQVVAVQGKVVSVCSNQRSGFEQSETWNNCFLQEITKSYEQK